MRSGASGYHKLPADITVSTDNTRSNIAMFTKSSSEFPTTESVSVGELHSEAELVPNAAVRKDRWMYIDRLTDKDR